ncbi:V-type proton ATPase subunit E [invertebrate metagenome]|uniref:V-type proton ATPase subunit E n=1 Tax=invertebrate metagenome TaxID=1711999 RepID=A0A2H9TBN0_9ZZZZ
MTIAIRPDDKNVSVGVQDLIEKLRKQGVKSGRDDAEKIVSNANAEAGDIIKTARQKAFEIVEQAKKEAAFITKAGEEALQLAERNTLLEMKDYLLKQFSEQISAVVKTSLEDEALLEKMILEVAGENSLQGEESVEVVLPQKVIGVEELRTHPELIKSGGLLDFVMNQASTMLQKGVTFKVGGEEQTGISFRLNNKDIQIELSDETVCAVLLQHLQPRFRALLEGIVK